MLPLLLVATGAVMVSTMSLDDYDNPDVNSPSATENSGICVIRTSATNPDLTALLRFVDHITRSSSKASDIAEYDILDSMHWRTNFMHCPKDVASLQVDISGLLLRILSVNYLAGQQTEESLVAIQEMRQIVVDSVRNLRDSQNESRYQILASKLDDTFFGLISVATQGRVRNDHKETESSPQPVSTTKFETELRAANEKINDLERKMNEKFKLLDDFISAQKSTLDSHTQNIKERIRLELEQLSSETKTAPSSETDISKRILQAVEEIGITKGQISNFLQKMPANVRDNALDAWPNFMGTLHESGFLPPQNFTHIKQLGTPEQQLAAYKFWFYTLNHTESWKESTRIIYEIIKMQRDSSVYSEAEAFLLEKVRPEFLKLLRGEWFTLENYVMRGNYWYMGRTKTYSTVKPELDPDIFWESAMMPATVKELHTQDKWKYQFLPVPEREGAWFYLRNRLMVNKPVPPLENWNNNFLVVRPGTSVLFDSSESEDEFRIMFFRTLHENELVTFVPTNDNGNYNGGLPGTQVNIAFTDKEASGFWIPHFL